MTIVSILSKMAEMNKHFNYTDEDYKKLETALDHASAVCYGRPDQFQYYQNELTIEITKFLLKPYVERQLQSEQNKELVKVNNELSDERRKKLLLALDRVNNAQ
jgi:hypothetical protein